MPERPTAPSDQDLLANAIPIDHASEDASDDHGDQELTPIDIADLDADLPDVGRSSKISVIGQRKPHEDHWKRQPNATGTGAIHVKTFVAKLRYDAIEHLDEQVNHWLDNHPEYEVKFVTTTVGELRGKLLEPALFMNVWV